MAPRTSGAGCALGDERSNVEVADGGLRLEPDPGVRLAFMEQDPLAGSLEPQEVVGGPEVDDVGLAPEARADRGADAEAVPELASEDADVGVAVGPRLAPRDGSEQHDELDPRGVAHQGRRFGAREAEAGERRAVH